MPALTNNFITVKEIAQNILPRLQDKLVFPMLCNNDFSSDFVAGKGDTIIVRKPNNFTAADHADGTDVTFGSVKEESVAVTLDHLASVDLKITAKEASLNIEDFNKQILEPAAAALAKKINEDGLKLYKDIPYYSGTAATTPDGLDDFANARKVLNGNKAPDAPRYGVWDVEADAKFVQLGNLVKVNEAGDTSGLREGQIGRVFGLDNYYSQAIQKHTTGATGTILTDGGSETEGATKIHMDGLESKFNVGDIFTIADMAGSYVVTKCSDLTSTDADVEFYPGLAANAADNKAVTVIATHTANLVFQKDAFAFVNRPLADAPGTDCYTAVANGLAVRVVRDYDVKEKREITSVDILYGYKTLIPELACRYLG